MLKEPYALFDTRITARHFISPTLLRITLSGPDLALVGTTGLDQRIKLLFVRDDAHADAILARNAPWRELYSSLPEDEKPVARTYTFAELRPAQCEVDIDVVIHDGHAHGPGSAFALEAPYGSRVIMSGPRGDVPGHDELGIAWYPDYDILQNVLLVGDETALPAIRGILKQLPAQVSGRAVIEVPYPEDIDEEVTAPDGVEVVWCVRDAGQTAFAQLPFPVTEEDKKAFYAGDEDEMLWQEEAEPGQWLGWVAGETQWVAKIRSAARRAGIAKRQASFMGYWRKGARHP
ncbi:siderophore-interacting protein [Dermabacteraceae bacterium P13077]